MPNAAVAVVISPAGVLLTADRPSHHLTAATDATGVVTSPVDLDGTFTPS